MRSVLVALLLVPALLAGCADSPSGTASEVEPEDIQFESDVLQLAQPGLLPSQPPADGERTLDAAPEWRLGEWWQYRMTDEFTGATYEFMRVVAGQDPVAGNYLVGFPIDAFSNDVMILHVPGYGDIRQSDLAYETHDSYFQPLQFPLRDGDSWEMSFEGAADGLASVSLPGDGTAQVTMEVSVYGFINATYDPAIGEISKLSIAGYGSYEVIDHGYNFQGAVRVPHAHDLIFIHGRVAGAVAASGNDPVGPPGDIVEVPEGYDRASFILAVGAGPFLGNPVTGEPMPSDAPAGVFQESATAPDGTTYTLTLLPHEGGFKIQAYGHEDPAGTWNMQHVAGGAGVAFIEGIGYHSIDIELPSGCVIESVNAQHHQAPCRVDN